jgi:nucleotide-binding universal stress UspA family protein
MLPFKKIVCPTDFSEPSNQALEAGGELAAQFKAELLVVHVVPQVPPVSPGIVSPRAFNVSAYQEELVQSSSEALEELIKNRLPKSLKVKPMVIQGDAAEEIARIAQEESADLIVIATHGLTGWRRFVFGSVAEKVVRTARGPVLTIHPPPETDE